MQGNSSMRPPPLCAEDDNNTVDQVNALPPPIVPEVAPPALPVKARRTSRRPTTEHVDFRVDEQRRARSSSTDEDGSTDSSDASDDDDEPGPPMRNLFCPPPNPELHVGLVLESLAMITEDFHIPQDADGRWDPSLLRQPKIGQLAGEAACAVLLATEYTKLSPAAQRDARQGTHAHSAAAAMPRDRMNAHVDPTPSVTGDAASMLVTLKMRFVNAATRLELPGHPGLMRWCCSELPDDKAQQVAFEMLAMLKHCAREAAGLYPRYDEPKSAEMRPVQ